MKKILLAAHNSFSTVRARKTWQVTIQASMPNKKRERVCLLTSMPCLLDLEGFFSLFPLNEFGILSANS